MLLPGKPLGPLSPLAPGKPLGPCFPVGPVCPFGPTGPTGPLLPVTGLAVVLGFGADFATTGLGFRFLGGSFFFGVGGLLGTLIPMRFNASFCFLDSVFVCLQFLFNQLGGPPALAGPPRRYRPTSTLQNDHVSLLLDMDFVNF